MWQVIHITESRSNPELHRPYPGPERALPACGTAQPLAPGVPPSWRTPGGVTSLAFPQGSRSSREIPAGCSSSLCQDSALPHLPCPEHRDSRAGRPRDGTRVSGISGTRPCPQHRQVRHLGPSNSRSESALGCGSARAPRPLTEQGYFPVSNVKPSFLCCSRGPALCFCPSRPAAASLLGPGSLWFPCDSSLEAGMVLVIVFLAGDKTGPS